MSYRRMVAAAIVLEGLLVLTRIVESDPDLAAVVILERVRKLEAKWAALQSA